MRIVLADDHVMVRAGIRSLLERIPGVVVVGEADTGQQALQLVAQLQPDVLVADIAMKDLSGLEVAARVAAGESGTKVLMLSMHRSDDYVIQALQAGCAGYLVKDSAASDLEAAIAAMERNETYLSASVAHALGRYFAGASTTPSASRLTPRQREVLKLLAEGKTTKEIAAALHVSVKTVESHRSELMRRLDIRDVAGLVRYAMRTGLVPPES